MGSWDECKGCGSSGEVDSRERCDDCAYAEENPKVIKLFRDGNLWCVLYGENIQEGICVFGETQFKALREFADTWQSEVDHA